MGDITPASLIIVPILMMMALSAVTGVSNPDVDAAIAIFDCPWPEYTTGYNATGLPDCQFIEQNDGYDNDIYVLWNVTEAWYTGGNDWVGSIPDGHRQYLGDYIHRVLADRQAQYDVINESVQSQDVTILGSTTSLSAIAGVYAFLLICVTLGIIMVVRG